MTTRERIYAGHENPSVRHFRQPSTQAYFQSQGMQQIVRGIPESASDALEKAGMWPTPDPRLRSFMARDAADPRVGFRCARSQRPRFISVP
jgi:hypothetical protein